jgi:hypothetical protein
LGTDLIFPSSIIQEKCSGDKMVITPFHLLSVPFSLITSKLNSSSRGSFMLSKVEYFPHVNKEHC